MNFKRKLWSIFHNAFAHPVMALGEVLPTRRTSEWGYSFHEWTAEFFPHDDHEDDHEPLDPNDPEVQLHEALEGICINSEIVFHDLSPEDFQKRVLSPLQRLEADLAYLEEHGKIKNEKEMENRVRAMKAFRIQEGIERIPRISLEMQERIESQGLYLPHISKKYAKAHGLTELEYLEKIQQIMEEIEND